VTESALVNLRQVIVSRCRELQDSRRLRIELLRLLNAAVPFDYAYFSTTDPATLLITGSVMAETPPTWLMSAFVENEYLHPDYNKFSDMVRREQTVTILTHVAGGELARSPRYQTMLAPMGIGDELRAVFLSGRNCWGTLCLHRVGEQSAFTAAEGAFIAQISRHISRGMRMSLQYTAALLSEEQDAPGVLILSDDGAVLATTQAAAFWLAELGESTARAEGLPSSILSLTAAFRAFELGLRPTLPQARVRTPSGHWLVLRAARLAGAERQHELAVLIEPAQPVELMPLMTQVYQLTARECEVIQHVLRGSSTLEIATALCITANTVQDHLKSIFEKVGVHSRGELAAHLSRRHYQPLANAGTPLTSSGQFRT
jgi:DNA-binding CsgD family transcriptional regulator